MNTIMKENNKSTITSIIIDCELFMYGVVTLSIDRSEEGLNTFWFGASDGGMYVEEGNQAYPGKSFEELLSILLSVEYPKVEEEEECFNWSIRVSNEDDEYFLLEIGQWGRVVFNSVIELIDNYLADCKCTQMFHDMM